MVENPSNKINIPDIYYPLGEGFEVDHEGVWYTTSSSKTPQKIFVCSPLIVLAYARNEYSENFCQLLQFYDPDKKEHMWLMPRELLADGGELRKTLLSKGLKLGEDKSAKDLLIKYLLSCDPDDRVRTIDRTGWYGQSYVLPRETLGQQIGEKVYFIGQLNTQPIFSQAGTLKEWQEKVGTLCVGNSRLLFAASAGFAGPLLGICHEENGGFHLRGGSSTGKTTALHVAASIFGGKDFIQKWRATSNGIEATAKMYNDQLLPLDEMGEINPKDAGEVAYMLGNGTGKARANKSGDARDKAKFRCLFLSTGEISLGQHMLEDGKKTKAGQETRIADIPADLGIFGVFDTIHHFDDGATFADAIKDVTREYHGVVGREYINKLSEDFDMVRTAVDATIDMFMQEHVPHRASGQVKRVARRFGLVAAGGELAIYYGITPWKTGTAITAVSKCFNDWLDHRGNDQDLEEQKIFSQVQLFFERHAQSRFSLWDEDQSIITYNRAGFKKPNIESGKTEYYVLEEVFKNEICQGLDWKRAAKSLVIKSYLKPSSDGKSTRSESLPGIGKVRCYRFEKIPIEEMFFYNSDD